MNLLLASKMTPARFPRAELETGNRRTWRTWLFAALVAMQLFSPAAYALDAEQIFDKVAPSIVLIPAQDGGALR